MHMTGDNGKFREPPWSRPRDWTRGNVKTGLFAGALLAAVAATSARADTIVQYVFSPDASIILSGDSDGSFTNNVAEMLSGGFSWDTTTDSLASVDVTVSGSFLTATFTAPGGSDSHGWFVSSSAGSVEVQFQNDLGLGAADPLEDLNYHGSYPMLCSTSGGGCGTIVSLTGSAGPGEVPEPAAMSVLGVGLAGLGMIRRRRAMRRTL